MAAIGIAYTSNAGTTYNVTFDEFRGAEFARTYDGSVEFQRTATGTTSIAGLGRRQKYIWAINAHLTEAKAEEVDNMFKAWDNDRAQGRNVACGITDQTLFNSITSTAIFSTPPSFTYIAPNRIAVALGMTEI